MSKVSSPHVEAIQRAEEALEARLLAGVPAGWERSEPSVPDDDAPLTLEDQEDYLELAAAAGGAT